MNRVFTPFWTVSFKERREELFFFLQKFSLTPILFIWYHSDLYKDPEFSLIGLERIRQIKNSTAAALQFAH